MKTSREISLKEQQNKKSTDRMHRNNLIHSLIKTDAGDLSALIMRLALGIIMFPHGAQKLLGWFNGFGFSGSMEFFTETIGLPWIIALLFVLAESVGSILLIIGLGTRVIAAIYVIIMAGAAYTHLPNGFFMNWFNNQSGEGIEFHLLMLVLALVVTIKGAGKASVEGLLYKKMRSHVFSVRKPEGGA